MNERPTILTDPITKTFRKYNEDVLHLSAPPVKKEEEEEKKEEHVKSISSLLHRYQRKLKLTDEEMIQELTDYLNDIGEYTIQKL